MKRRERKGVVWGDMGVGWREFDGLMGDEGMKVGGGERDMWGEERFGVGGFEGVGGGGFFKI